MKQQSNNFVNLFQNKKERKKTILTSAVAKLRSTKKPFGDDGRQQELPKIFTDSDLAEELKNEGKKEANNDMKRK